MNINFYQTGGSLPANSPSYIPREADTQLYNYLKESKYCYVLNARQIGKSSLRVRTSKRLEDEGYRCVNIDITAIGSQNIEVDKWYFSLVNRILKQLSLNPKEYKEFWRDNDNITVIDRFAQVIDKVLDECSENIIIFLDEIDSILGIDIFSADDFFAVIRTFYNLRSEDAKYNRLSFAIFGVATAEDLMRDSSRTPFNIAHSIKLPQFSFEESMPLTDGLENQTVEAKKILQKVFDYTSGTPYLTQKILAEIASHPIKKLEDIDTIIDKLFIQKGFEESNISNIQNRIISDEKYNIKMLNLIAQIISKTPIGIPKQELGNEGVVAVESDNTQIYLKLSGLAKSENGVLVYNNRIYAMLFDREWVEAQLAKFERLISKDMNRWIELDRDKSALLRGAVLKEAKKWAVGREDLSVEENRFLRESIENEAQKKLFKTIAFATIHILLVSLGLIYYYFENRDFESKLNITSSSIDNRLELLNSGVKDNREYQSYTIPTSIDEIVPLKKEILDYYGIVDRKLAHNHSAIVKILLNTIEFNYTEKRLWFSTLPSMSDTQKEKFFKILQTKAKQDYIEIGNQYYFKQQYNKAIEAYTKAIEINPKNDEAYYNMGIAYANLKEYNKAIIAYTKAIEINPSNDDDFTKAFFKAHQKANQP